MKTKEEKGAVAFDLQRRIISNERARRHILAENAQLLTELKDKGLYKVLMDKDNGTWAGFLADPEILYSRNEIHSMVKLYNTYTKKLGLKPEDYFDLPHSRLLDIVPVVTLETWEDWYSKIQTLTARDWRMEVREAKGLITEETEDHEHNYQDYKICKDCGAKHKAESVTESVDN
jgi:hypothetical protein